MPSSNSLRARIRISRFSLKLNKLQNLLRAVNPERPRKNRKIMICLNQLKVLFKKAETHNDVDQNTTEIFYRLVNNVEFINDLIENHRNNLREE